MHEAFSLTTQDEDIFRLREAFKILLEDTDKEIIGVLCENIGVILNRYTNEHGVQYYFQRMKELDGATPSSSTNGVSKGNFDFTSVSTNPKKEEKKSSKSVDAKKQSSLSATHA